MALPARKIDTIITQKEKATAVSRYDPTRTTHLRNAFVRDLNKRFRALRGIIRRAIIEQDCFGMLDKEFKVVTLAAPDFSLPGRKAFAFPRSEQKVNAFMNWLQGQEAKGILEVGTMQQIGTPIETAWTNKYIKDSYQRGVIRARMEMKGAGYKVPPLSETGGISASMSTPFHMDRVGVLYTRVFQELKGITSQMDTQISRVLTQGIADGKNPRELAKLLTRTISGPVGDLGITDTLGRFIPAERRARTLARTEVIRAHHQGNIQEMKNWAVEGVKVKAEWVTAGYKVCPECAALEGKVFSLNEIQNMIPLHPNCRCVAIPVKKEEEKKVGKVPEVPKELPSPKQFIDNLEEAERIRIHEAVADWKQGKEYTRYYQYADVGKADTFEFTGNDILQSRKRAIAEKQYASMNRLINGSANYEGKVFKFAHRGQVKIKDNSFSFLTKESWTKDIQGMSSFANEGGYLIEFVSKRNNIVKFVDIEKIGLGNFEVEKEVIQQAGAQFRVVSSKQIMFDSYFHGKKIPLTKLVVKEVDMAPPAKLPKLPEAPKGAAIERFEIPVSIKTRIHEQYDPLNLLAGPEWNVEFRRLGHSTEAIREASALLRAHGLTGGIQKKADQEIVKHFLDKDSAVGSVLRCSADMEEKAYLEWKRGKSLRLERARKECEDWWEDFYRKEAAEQGIDNFDDFWETIKWEYEEKPYMVYRGGSIDTPIQSWTKNPAGAWTGGAGHIKVEHTMKVDDMLATNKKPLGGFCRMMGAPGESEVTFIDLDLVEKMP